MVVTETSLLKIVHDRQSEEDIVVDDKDVYVVFVALLLRLRLDKEALHARYEGLVLVSLVTSTDGCTVNLISELCLVKGMLHYACAFLAKACIVTYEISQLICLTSLRLSSLFLVNHKFSLAHTSLEASIVCNSGEVVGVDTQVQVFRLVGINVGPVFSVCFKIVHLANLLVHW